MKIMKYLITIITLLTVLFYSCDTLDVEPTNRIDADQAIVDQNSLAAAVNGAYDQLQSTGFAEDGIIFGDLAADNYFHVGSKKEYAQVDNNELVASNEYIEGIWNSCYDGINRVNNILVKVNSLDNVSPEKLNYYIGQCYFIRAIDYFTLVKYFGGVPIRIKPTTDASPGSLNKARESIENTYGQVIADLDSAEGRLTGINFNKSAFASYYATKALKARVYLYFSQYEDHWADAASNALDVINNNAGIELEDGANYSNIFTPGTDSKEIIFDVNFSNDDDKNAIADWSRPEGRLEIEATASIYNAFDPSDLRRDVTVEDNSGEYYSNKYRDVGGGKDDIVILRLAEMYLIRAEALNEISYVANGEAFNLLNTIRNRAGLPDLNSSNTPTQNSFRLAIEKERRLEFAFEGQRFFDLRRTGRINDVLPQTGNMDENDWLFPIPQTELDANDLMTQNGTY